MESRYLTIGIASATTEFFIGWALNRFFTSDGSFGSGISIGFKLFIGLIVFVLLYLFYLKYTLPENVRPTYNVEQKK